MERLASYIMDDIEDANLMVLCVLKGGYKFCSDLVEFIKTLGRSSDRYLETRVEFIRLKSYLVGKVLKNSEKGPFSVYGGRKKMSRSI